MITYYIDRHGELREVQFEGTNGTQEDLIIDTWKYLVGIWGGKLILDLNLYKPKKDDLLEVSIERREDFDHWVDDWCLEGWIVGNDNYGWSNIYTRNYILESCKNI